MVKKKTETKKEQLPLVSIVIPVYNGSNYMREAIDSALNQDYPNIEILVVNDGSTDGGKTAEIAKSYGNKIKYFEKENGGVSTALNFAIKKMKGEFFSWLSHDDRYYSNKISTQVNYLIDNNLLNKKVITYTNYDVIDENSKKISETHFEIYKPNKRPELAMLRGLISGTALLIPKGAFEEYGVFDTKYRCIQDYLLFFNFMKSYTYIHIPKITNSTRVHAGQVTNVNPKVIEENNYLWTMMQKETTDEAKIRLMHSIYDFYMRMERYLRRNMVYTKNDYVEARQYSLTKAEEIKKKGEEKLIKIVEMEAEEDIYNILVSYYDNCHKFVKINDVNVNDKKINLEKKIIEIINKIGLFNTINLAFTKTTNEKIKKNYSKMMSHISYMYSYYLPKENDFNKVKAYYNTFGIISTLKLIRRKVISYVKSNKYLSRILKICRILLKIIFFIPKKIIQLILYV